MPEVQGRVTLWGIEVFLAVAEEGAISAAAKRLGVSPSAISQQLTGLESALGAVLLDRSARPMRPTPAGAMFRRHAQTILNAEAEARAELGLADLSGLTTLRLGMIEDFDAEVTPRLLSALAQDLKGCRFLLETGASHRLLDQLESRALDMVVAADLGSEAADDGWREVHPLLAEPFLAVTPKGRTPDDLPLIQYTARHLMGELLGALKPQESFNILFFSGGSRVLSPEPLPATPDNVQRALAMMQGIDGGGGTELLPALQRAFAMPRTADLARSLVVVTDGFIGAEREAYDLIRAERNRSNLFAFGIGSSVNRHLLEGMAHAGAGEPFIVTSPAEATEAGARFRRYIQSPLLGRIAIHGDGVELYDLEPAEIPVMLAERPIVVFGKYRGEGKSAGLEITGQAASGEYRTRLPLVQGQGEGRTELLPAPPPDAHRGPARHGRGGQS